MGSPKNNIHMRRTRYVIETENPIIRAIFEKAGELHMSESELARRSGYSPATLFYLRTDGRDRAKHRRMGGNLTTICDLAEVVGLQLVLVPIEPVRAPYAGQEEGHDL